MHSFEGTFSAHSGVIKLKDARSITFIPYAKGGARERASTTDMVHTEEEEGEKANKVYFLSSFSSSSDHKEQLRVWCVQRRVIVLFLFFLFYFFLVRASSVFLVSTRSMVPRAPASLTTKLSLHRVVFLSRASASALSASFPVGFFCGKKETETVKTKFGSNREHKVREKVKEPGCGDAVPSGRCSRPGPQQRP